MSAHATVYLFIGVPLVTMIAFVVVTEEQEKEAKEHAMRAWRATRRFLLGR